MTDNYLPRVLGGDTADASNPYMAQRDVIGAVETSPSGNTILRLGVQEAGQDHWEGGLGHVVLTATERDALRVALVRTDANQLADATALIRRYDEVSATYAAECEQAEKEGREPSSNVYYDRDDACVDIVDTAIDMLRRLTGQPDTTD